MGSILSNGDMRDQINGITSKVPNAGGGKALIIGAGCSGLALAQGLEKTGKPYEVYERDGSPETRWEWSMGLNWVAPALQTLMPEELFARIQDTQVDPHHLTTDMRGLPIINGSTGEQIGEVKSSKSYRLRRDKIRKRLAERLDVRWGRTMTDVSYSINGETVTLDVGNNTSTLDTWSWHMVLA